MTKENKMKNIGINVKSPSESCEDLNCPFHGKLPVRGQIITGEVTSMKMQGSLSVRREFMHYVKKYERYEKRTSNYLAHCPPCLKIKNGDNVRIAECRPLSKSISFVVIEKL